MAHQKFVIWIMSDPSLNTKSHLFPCQIADSSFRIRSCTKYILFHNICKIENFSAPFLHFTSSGVSICRVPYMQVTGASGHPSSLCAALFPTSWHCFPGQHFALRALFWKTQKSLPLYLKKLKLRFGVLQCPAFCVGEHRCWHNSADHFLPAVISLGPAEGAH